MDRVRQAFKICSSTNFGIGAFVTIVAVVAPGLIASLFTSSPEMIEASVHALRLCLYGFAFVGFQVTATQFFQSIGFGGKALLLSLSRQILFLLPALFLFPPALGCYGCMARYALLGHRCRGAGDDPDVLSVQDLRP